jgi:acyl carrier protein
MSSSPSTPSPLARFPASVRDAYQNFLAHRQPADLHVIIDAVLMDFMPKGKELPAGQSIPVESRLVEDLGFDSLAVAEIVFFFEDLLQISIPTQEVTSLQTVSDLQAFVERKLASRPQASVASR